MSILSLATSIQFSTLQSLILTVFLKNEIKPFCRTSFLLLSRFISAVTTDDCFIVDRSLNTSKLAAQRPGLIIEPGQPGDPRFLLVWGVYFRKSINLSIKWRRKIFIKVAGCEDHKVAVRAGGRRRPKGLRTIIGLKSSLLQSRYLEAQFLMSWSVGYWK